MTEKKSKKKRISVSIDPNLLEKVKNKADGNTSDYVCKALEFYLKRDGQCCGRVFSDSKY